MRRLFAAVGLILVFLAVFIPFASTNPDGLKTVANTVGLQAEEPFWNGLMANYSIAAVGNPYISTFVAGTFGTVMVLAVAFLLGTAMKPNKNQPNR
jgi:uncharacterized membrane protein